MATSLAWPGRGSLFASRICTRASLPTGRTLIGTRRRRGPPSTSPLSTRPTATARFRPVATFRGQAAPRCGTPCRLPAEVAGEGGLLFDEPAPGSGGKRAGPRRLAPPEYLRRVRSGGPRGSADLVLLPSFGGSPEGRGRSR